MIFYLVTRPHQYTFGEYLDTWGKENRGRMTPLFYDSVFRQRSFRRGTYIFSDLERLNAAQLELAGMLHGALGAAGEGVRLLNDPAKVLRRESLLRELHRAGANPFAVYGARENLDRLRFPAFIRRQSTHDGSLTPLLNGKAELDAAISNIAKSGIPTEDLLIVEYCQTVDERGMFRKYSAFCLAGKIIPRHLLHSGTWMLKTPDVVTAETVAEERAYQTGNPHELQVGEIFKLANIDYGRIDYSLCGERIVTWEINTNPLITVVPWDVAATRMEGQAEFARRFTVEMKGIDPGEISGPSIRVEKMPVRLLREARGRKRDCAVDFARRALRRVRRRIVE